MDLSLASIINVSVSQQQPGAGAYNTSNIALFTAAPFADTFGDLGYNIYLSPTQVGIDFGTDSEPFAIANAIFSQQPNILNNGGYLVIIPLRVAVQNLSLSGVPAAGSFTIAFTQGTTAAIEWNDTADQIQTKIQAVAGLGSVTVSGSLSSEAIVLTLAGVYGPQTLPTVGGAGLTTSVPADITITPTTTTAGETLAAAITASVGLVQYFGICTDNVLDQADVLAAAAVVQALVKILFIVETEETTVEAGGLIDLLRTGSFTQTRGLYYGGSVTDPLVYMGSYMGLGLSVNFGGSLTTITMHMKTLIGVEPDDSMTPTIANLCNVAGADYYASFQGVPKNFCSGGNNYYDNVYNTLWFAGDIQIAGFNVIAEASTKVTQTESGMDIFKQAYGQVCEQGVANNFLAPGSWTNPSTFGNQVDFYLNIAQRGYYIYSTPIAQQNPTDRANRVAPLVQIAIKFAGAVQSGTVIISVNP